MKTYIPVIGEITAETLKEYFSIAHKDRQATVLVSSPGGDVGYMLAMLDDIDYRNRQTFATGICQSAAAVLATAGEGLRVCTMDTLFRFIPPEPKTLGGEIDDLDYYLHSVRVARLAARLKCERIEVHDLFDGKFISSTRAKELGLIDEVISTEEINGNSVGLSGSERKTDGGPFGQYRFADV